MTHGIEGHLRAVSAPMEQCWRHVGIGGDRSCPELATLVHCRNCPVLEVAARHFFDRPVPAGYLESWREVIEQPPAPVDTDARGVLVFRVGHEWLALPTSAIVEVTHPRRLHGVPHRSNGLLAGMVNIRGQLRLCVRLERVMGLEPTITAPENDARTARLVVVERAGSCWAWPVAEVAGIHHVPARSLRDLPATVSGDRARTTAALFTWREWTVGLIDETRLLDGLDRLISE